VQSRDHYGDLNATLGKFLNLSFRNLKTDIEAGPKPSLPRRVTKQVNIPVEGPCEAMGKVAECYFLSVGHGQSKHRNKSRTIR
jgi:hypothetical protein